MSRQHTSDFLVADIGGTHTRLTIIKDGGIVNAIRVFDNHRFPDLESLIKTFLDGIKQEVKPDIAAFAIACPVSGDKIIMTNLGWKFSIEEFKKIFGFSYLHIINDFAALALSIPELAEHDKIQIGAGQAIPENPIAVIGPGTGLGVSALVPVDNRWIPIACEGGHVTLAAVTEMETEIIDQVRKEYGHVSAERLLSGPGISLLYNTIAGLAANNQAATISPEEITRRALATDDPIAVDTLDTFFSMLGTVAGNLALTIGARGGVYLAGGILPKLITPLRDSSFRKRFVDKGRYVEYLDAIPTYVIIDEYPAIKGLNRLLKEKGV